MYSSLLNFYRFLWDAKYQVWELGLTVTAGTILAMPLMWNSETLIEYCGYTNIFIVSFAFYIIRFTGKESQTIILTAKTKFFYVFVKN
jgi:MFS_1 like family